MKTLSEDAVAMIEGRNPVIAGAARFVFGSGTYRFWSGYGNITIEDQTFIGVGARALLTPIESAIGGAADGMRIRLSELDPDIAQSVEAEDYHQKPVTIWRLFFAEDKVTLLDAAIFMRGRVDTIIVSETVGGDAAIEVAIEGPRRDMNRAGARIRGDADQRTLGGGSDGGMRHVSISGRKVLSWGQKPEVAGEVVTPSGGIGGGKRGIGLYGQIL